LFGFVRRPAREYDLEVSALFRFQERGGAAMDLRNVTQKREPEPVPA
jgi:hypothetical protein